MPRWTYSIAIINETDRPLELVSSNVPWGKCEHDFPTKIAPKKTGEFKVYSPAGAPWGLEFYFSMRDVPSGNEDGYGFCHFSVDMPYWKHKNTSHFACEGMLGSQGFMEVPDGAHDFSTTVHVFSKLDREAIASIENKAIMEDELNVKEPGNYMNLYGWDKVNSLAVIDDEETPLEKFIPEQNTIKSRIMFGRTETRSVPKKFWSQIKDKKYPGAYSKRFVEDYFTVLVYELRRKELKTIAAKESCKEEVEISNTSTVRRETNTEFLIENTIDMNVSNKEIDLSANLRTQYDISRLDEYCEENQKTIRIAVEYESADYDRDIVLWRLVEVLELYRINKNGKVELVAIGDYYLTDTQRTYRTSKDKLETLFEREGTDSEYIYCSENEAEVLNSELLCSVMGGKSVVQGDVTINGVKYDWMEERHGGTRCIKFTTRAKPRKCHKFEIAPDPHCDTYYKEHADKWYRELVTAIRKQGDKGGWTAESWNGGQEIRRLDVNHTSYTCTPI